MIGLLLASALLLGLLAFFEPCTIATHTLFAARSSQADSASRNRDLLTIWLVRYLLLAGLFAIAVVALPRPDWGAYAPSILLSIMALLYLVSRRAYIPVPHLAFHRLLPGGAGRSEVLRVGLTLPACTLPLLMVVGALAVTLDSVVAAIVAGFVFATAFTAPLVYASVQGMDNDERQLLDRAARGSPYLTAALLFGAALALLLLQVDFSAERLATALETQPVIGLGLAFLAGFVFSFNPVSFAAIPVVLAYVTRAHERKRALFIGLAFVAGLIATHVVLGVIAAAGGDWVQKIMGREWGLVLGPLLILLGLLWTGWLKLRLPWLSVSARRVEGPWGAFLLGIPFSIAVCPFCAPALLVTLTTSAAIGSVPFGFLLLLSFAVGRSLPILAGAWSMGWLESLAILSRYQHALEIVGGLVLIGTGLYMLNAYLLVV